MADGRPTKAWGSKLIPLQFGSRRFQFQFLLADVDQPILGADFLAEFDLLVDTKNHQVLQNRSFEPLAPPRFSPSNSSVASVCKLAPDVASLLDEFPAAWNPRTPGKPPEHKLKLSSKNWNRRGLSAGLIVLGPHLYIWFKNLMDPGVLVAITAV